MINFLIFLAILFLFVGFVVLASIAEVWRKTDEFQDDDK